MEQNLIQKFADPDLIMEMSVADKLKATLVTGLTGLGVTFVVLVSLMLIIILLRRWISRYEMNSEYRHQVHRARRLRKAKLSKRKDEAEQHGFETVEHMMRSTAVTGGDPADGISEDMAGMKDGQTQLFGDDTPDEETAAVIIAAISAYEGTPAEQLKIRKIERRPYEEALWKAGAGRPAQIREGWKSR